MNTVHLYDCLLTEVAEKAALQPPRPITVLIKRPVRVDELHVSVHFVARVGVECNAACSEAF